MLIPLPTLAALPLTSKDAYQGQGQLFTTFRLYGDLVNTPFDQTQTLQQLCLACSFVLFRMLEDDRSRTQ